MSLASTKLDDQDRERIDNIFREIKELLAQLRKMYPNIASQIDTVISSHSTTSANKDVIRK